MSTILGSLNDASLSRAWLTIGSFDGVHLGHQYLIKKLVDGAHAVGSPAVVLTFHPHPVVVLQGKTGDIYLTLPEERANILIGLGVDLVIIEPFTRELSQTTALEFIERLKNRLGLEHLLIGHDFALGHNREGTFEVLSKLGLEYEFNVEEVEALQFDGETVSSRQIRLLLERGEVSRANLWLGRSYLVSGEVVPGDHRGRTIGFPTANLSVTPGKILPGSGIYACRAWVDGQPWGAATNIGTRPTFDEQGTKITLEAYLLDYSGDLYGQIISLEFIERLRDEVRFPDIQTLIEQINQDVVETRELLARSSVRLTKQ
jgi:riboflavin kinase/FMN adenylyltransferase